MEALQHILSGIGHFFVGVFNNVDKIASFFTIAAIIAGLWWFYKRREKAPRANIEHDVQFVDLENGTTYVGITYRIQNTGNVVIRPKIAEDTTSSVTIEELKPYLAKKIESQDISPMYKLDFLGGRAFPPGVCVEPDATQSLLFEFIIQNSTQAIRVYSHLDNDYNDGVAWDLTTTHEVAYDKT
ncbi:MAG TPA: hypothetical protein VLE73_03640 [Candidatus Saccharimonadales bacterium]|nr:hypothetical protein [Candidatus Saccharimonadales bacterium]